LAKIFDDILLKGIRAGQMPARNSSARVWYREKAKQVGKINETTFFRTADRDRFNSANQFRIGNMYMFYYDPKFKDTLPYYDRVPLIFPINRAKGGFLGINFHYLPLKLRAKLMDSLYDVVSNDSFDETTKLQVSYKILNASSQYREFRPTVKHYLFNHVRSKLMYINPSEWDIALFLNIAKFEGATQTQVWEDSRKIIRGSR
jgi:hypothetical protein